ncbi:hypothetical protein Ancab_024996 [Ancistrocladus abbreviatus]
MAFKWVFNTFFTHLLSCHSTENLACPKEGNHGQQQSIESLKEEMKEDDGVTCFQMPLHYPRYTKADYAKMEEWKVDMLLREYGLDHFKGDLDEKRKFAMGAFLWPDQA